MRKKFFLPVFMRRLLRWIDKVDDAVFIGLLEVLAILLLISVWQLVEDELRVLYAVILAVFLVRFAARIRYIRFFWVGMLGEHDFWEWVQLLCAPLLVSIVGVMIATRINQKQGDLSVIGDRLDISADYFSYMESLDPAKQPPQPQVQTGLEEQQADPQKDLQSERQAWLEEYERLLRDSDSSDLDERMGSENCDPQRNVRIPSLLYSKTAAALSALTELKTSDEKYSPTKKSILQALYYSGMIHRGNHVVSLQQSDISESRVSNIDLSWSCMDSVDFRDSYLRYIKLSDSNIRRSMFSGSDISNSKLERANLLGSDFSHTHLSNAKLKDAYLKQVNLSFSNLESADLSGAVLRDANLQSSVLLNANLSNTDLRGADLTGADLRGANMQGAILGKTNRGNTKLNDAVYNTRSSTNQNSLNFWNHRSVQVLFGLLDPLLKVESLKPRPMKVGLPWYPYEMWEEFKIMHLQNDARPAQKARTDQS